MALLRIGHIRFDADLIVFDKDGTLIDFEFMWGRLVRAWVKRLAPDANTESRRQDLYRGLGYDPRTRRTDGAGPLATAPMATVYTIAAAVLYRHGFSWEEAEAHAKCSFEATLAAIPLARLVRPVTDVRTLLSRLQGGDVRVAVVTTDDRATTRATLKLLGIEELVDFLACGDDSIAVKPAPDAVSKACAALKVRPARTAVVGDTIADMTMARQAGVGCCVAVLTGAGERDALAAHADVVLDSIAGIDIESP